MELVPKKSRLHDPTLKPHPRIKTLKMKIRCATSLTLALAASLYACMPVLSVAASSSSAIKNASPPAAAPKDAGANSGKAANQNGISDATIWDMKDQATELEKNGKLDEAEALLTKVTTLRPNDNGAFEQLAQVNIKRAQEYLKDNKFESALLAIRQALSACPNNTEANQILGQFYKKVGADPDKVESRLRTADALFKQGRYQEAEVEYQASLAVKITPDAYVGLGLVSEKLQEPEAGKPDFERALEIDGNSAAAHREIAQCYLYNGDVNSASAELSKALTLNPADKDAAARLVKLWQDQVAKSPDSNSHLGLARAYQLAGNLPAAQIEYKEVVSVDPNNPELPAARQSFKLELAKNEASKSVVEAQTLESQGRLQEAYSKVTTALGYLPKNSDLMLYQGDLLQKMNQPAYARQVYLKILEIQPQNGAAAQRIDQLETQMLAAQQRASVINPGASLPGQNSQVTSPSGSRVPVAPNNSMNNMYGAGTTNGAAPGVGPVDQVSSLASFMGQVRDQMQSKYGGKIPPNTRLDFGTAQSIAPQKNSGSAMNDASAGMQKDFADLSQQQAAAANSSSSTPNYVAVMAQPSSAAAASTATQNTPAAAGNDDFLSKMLSLPSASTTTSSASSKPASGKEPSKVHANTNTSWARSPQLHAKSKNARPSPLPTQSKSDADVAQKVRELERQNQLLKNKLKQLNESDDVENSPAPPAHSSSSTQPAPHVDPGGLYTGSGPE